MLGLIGFSLLRPLLVPPGSLFVLAALGWMLRKRKPRLGRGLIVASVVLLYALSTPVVGTGLLQSLQTSPALDPAHLPEGPQAIVVLGADLRSGADEFGGDTVSTLSLERLRYGAFLAQRTGLPLLVTGGVLRPSETPLAILMQGVLERELGVRVRWVEDAARDTQENARLSAALLKRDGVERVFLVTHAWHMPRAQLAFQHYGFEVIPAATDYATRYKLTLLDFLPKASALHDSSLVFHEVIGIGWYHLRILLGR